MVHKRKGKGLLTRKTSGEGILDWTFNKFLPKIGSKIAKPYEYLGVNPFDAGFQLGNKVIAPYLFGEHKKKHHHIPVPPHQERISLKPSVPVVPVKPPKQWEYQTF
jgi:hypothetical protein